MGKFHGEIRKNWKKNVHTFWLENSDLSGGAMLPLKVFMAQQQKK